MCATTPGEFPSLKCRTHISFVVSSSFSRETDQAKLEDLRVRSPEPSLSTCWPSGLIGSGNPKGRRENW